MVVDAYAGGLPLIGRFLTVELTDAMIDKGIARVAPGDPPPRFGDLYRKRLEGEGARERIYAILESLTLRGFAAAAAVNASRTSPSLLQDRPLVDRWSLILRNLSKTWHAVDDAIRMKPPTALSILITGIGRPAMEHYVTTVEELKLGRRRPFGTARTASYVPYFMALGFLVFDTATDEAAGARP